MFSDNILRFFICLCLKYVYKNNHIEIYKKLKFCQVLTYSYEILFWSSECFSVFIYLTNIVVFQVLPKTLKLSHQMNLISCWFWKILKKSKRKTMSRNTLYNIMEMIRWKYLKTNKMGVYLLPSYYTICKK